MRRARPGFSLVLSIPLLFLLPLSTGSLGCNANRLVGDEDQDGMSDGDGGGDDGKNPVTENSDGCRGRPCDTASPCPGGQRCVNTVCFVDNGTCGVDNDCQND